MTKVFTYAQKNISCSLHKIKPTQQYSPAHLFLATCSHAVFQTWHKPFLGDENQVCSKEEPHLFSRVDIYLVAEIYRRNIKAFFSRTAVPIPTKFGTKASLGDGNQVCSIGEPFNSHTVNNGFILLSINLMIIICDCRFELFSQVSDVAHGPLVNVFAHILILLLF